MSLASRVARLVRANLNARFGGAGGARPTSDPANGHREPYRDTRSERPDQDPVLAGYYANLELPYGADREAVRAARRRLLARYHPDRFATDPDKAGDAHDLVRQINHAHDELLKYLDRTG